jgi:uncharacterized iron-regulated membrane protein
MVKKLVGKIHLWLGLSVGLIVVFLGITGCMLAFQREIESITHTYDYVKAENKEFLQPSQLGKIAQAILPDKMLHSVTYGEKDRSAQVAFYQFEPSYYYIVYINPYRGEVLKVKDMDRDFFRILIDGHFYLWLPPHIGQPIVATATLIFVVMMITGIILWWPRNKAARKQRFTIKWNARWRRVNYDLHNVFGFYMSWVAIFIALTGLVFGFQWFAKAVYWTTSGGKQLTEFYEPTAGKANVSNDLPAIDRIYHKMKAEYATAETIEVHYPINDSVAIGAGANPDADTYWKIDYRWFDQRTLQEVEVKHLYGRFTTASTADKIARMNYDLHVGAIGGITTKIIAFFASLIAASLPITGFYIWWGRRKKKLSSKQQGLSNVELKPLQAV